jgi:hypothetical protein
VLRFGGLIGEEKSYILAGRKTSQQQCPLISFIKRIVGIILKIIQTNTWEKPIMPLLLFILPDQYIIPKSYRIKSDSANV